MTTSPAPFILFFPAIILISFALDRGFGFRSVRGRGALLRCAYRGSPPDRGRYFLTSCCQA